MIAEPSIDGSAEIDSISVAHTARPSNGSNRTHTWFSALQFRKAPVSSPGNHQ
jgi:hypothetical protein